MDRFQDQVVDYEADFVAWLEQQIDLLRERQFDRLDLGNLLEELEGAVRKERRELRHRLEVLITHLLKCYVQPQRKSRSWLRTLAAQRADIALLLEDSPSLRRHLAEFAGKAYPRAVRCAAEQTRIAPAAFPPSNPFSMAQMLDHDFIP